jgi:nucleotide-binding universal stress UspA family protein
MAILIGFDDTAFGRDAIELGLQLAGTTGEKCTVATGYPDDERGLMVAMQDHGWLTEVRQVAEKKLEAARTQVGDRGDVDFVPLGPSSASRALHEYAEQTGARMLVVGSSEHAAIGRISMGSTVEKLLHGSPCPVAVAPRGYRRNPAPLKVIAVAYDGSPESQQALDFAASAAERLRSSLRIAAVGSKYDGKLRAAVDGAAAGVPDGVTVTAEVIHSEEVVDTLADLPGDVDILVTGSRGYGPARQVLLGGVSNRVIRRATYPVIVVPRSASAR